MKGIATFGLLALVGAGHARADDRVLLLQNPGRPDSGLLSALRIQLTGAADADSRPAPANARDTPARIEAAAALARSEHALLVVWVDGPLVLPDGAREAVLYVVGQRQGRALLEVVHVPGEHGPDLERSLALKVREVVDQLRQQAAAARRAAAVQPAGAGQAAAAGAAGGAQPAGGEPAAALGGALIASPTPVPAPAAQREPGSALGLTLGFDAVASAQAGTALGWWGLQAHAGPELRAAAWRLDAQAVLRWLPSLQLRREQASVRVEQVSPGLLLHARMRGGPLWIGAYAGAAFALVDASGRDAAGDVGRRSPVLPVLCTGLALELPVAAGLGLELGLELRAYFARRRFAVDGVPVVDLGRTRPSLSLGLTYGYGPEHR